MIVQRIDYTNGSDSHSEDLKVTTLSDDSIIFKEIGISSSIEELRVSQTNDGNELILVRTEKNNVYVIRVKRDSTNDFTLSLIDKIVCDEILQCQKGIIFVKSRNGLHIYAEDKDQFKRKGDA